jgi:SAM-dependent methyltransferase
MSTAPFDPVTYKRTTTDQWQAAAEPWHRWAPTLEAWLGEATETMLDMAGVARTARVLDVAAGAGGQTLAAARRVGPDGHVLATDISSNILAFAERSAREAGLRNVETRVLDGEQLDVQPGTFDAVISRVGFIYFPDQHAAFVGMRLALRPGGRLAGIVYSTPEANGFFSIPVSVIRRRAQLPHGTRPRAASRAPASSSSPRVPPPRRDGAGQCTSPKTGNMETAGGNRIGGPGRISGDGGNRTHVRDRAKDGFYERSRRSVSHPPLAAPAGLRRASLKRCPPIG